MNRKIIARILVSGAVLVACGEENAPPGTGGEPSVEYLTPTEHLVRASMTLRGIRPSLEELSAVREDPSWVPAIIDHYLESPEMGATIREMHGEHMLSSVDAAIYPAGFPAVGSLAGMDVQRINESIVEAPTRLVEHVVMNDRPYHEIVTGDYTVADPIVSTVFGIPYDSAGDEWQVTRYDDGRPHAGVLSDSFLFTRHSSTFSNRNRGRAALVARAFLCYDFLDRQVEIDASIDLADEEAVANAIRTNPACVSCHQTLDPLASYFAEYFPIYVPYQLTDYPFEFYESPFGSYLRVTEPGYFGEPSSDVRDLGILIAGDPRFSMCAARRFYSYLAQLEQDAVPLRIVSELNDVFVQSGMSAKELVRAIVLSDGFRVARATGDEGADEVRGLRKARPEALARMIEDLTGYRWATDLPIDFGAGNVGRVDLMTDAFFGFEVLAGGTDSMSVTSPSFTMSASSALALRGLAARAAPYSVNADFAETDPGRRWLLRRVEPTDTDEAKVRAQLVDLHLRFYAETHGPDAAAIDDAWALWSGVLAQPDADPRRAWSVTLYAMLSDIRIAYY